MHPSTPGGDWFGAVSARLQRRWPTVDPTRLDDIALELGRDERLRMLPGERVADEWLRPVLTDAQQTPDRT